MDLAADNFSSTQDLGISNIGKLLNEVRGVILFFTLTAEHTLKEEKSQNLWTPSKIQERHWEFQVIE